MSRYVIRPRRAEGGWWEAPAQALPFPTVVDAGPVQTGVVDVEGNPIYRLPDPIGFLRKEDECKS